MSILSKINETLSFLPFKIDYILIFAIVVSLLAYGRVRVLLINWRFDEKLSTVTALLVSVVLFIFLKDNFWWLILAAIVIILLMFFTPVGGVVFRAYDASQRVK